MQLSGYAAQAGTNGGVQPASIDSVEVTVANFVGTIARTASITVQLYTGTTAIGTPTALTIAVTPNVQTVTLTGANAPTWAQMSDLRTQVVFTRAAVTTANVFSLDYVGVVVNHTVTGYPQRFTGSSTSGATTNNTVTTIPSAVAVGTLAFVSYASWGYGSASAPVVTIADSKGNTWTSNVDVRTSAVGAIEVWSTVLTTAWAAADTVTVTSVGDAGLNDYAMAVDVVSGYTNVGAEAGTLTSVTSTTPSATLTPSTSPTSALVYGFLTTMTTAPAVTEDADTVGGDSWRTSSKLITASVGRLVQLAGAVKVSTPGSTVQTYNPTLGASQLWESVVVMFPPTGAPPPPSPLPSPVILRQAVNRAATY